LSFSWKISSLISDIFKLEGAIEIGDVSNYLPIWGTEPNIEIKARDKQLKDLDEHVELLRDVFTGKTGIRIPDQYKKIQL